MKTFQDCKERVAKRYGYDDWDLLLSDRSAYSPLHQAAELYGRYCRFVGRAQKAQEIEDLAAWDEGWPDDEEDSDQSMFYNQDVQAERAMDARLVLTGKDAERFMKAANNPKAVTKEELERIRKSAAKFKRINF